MKNHKNIYHKILGTNNSKEIKAKRSKGKPRAPKESLLKKSRTSAKKVKGSTEIQRTAPKAPVNCKVCGKSISHNNLKRHMLNAHGTDGVKGNGAPRETEGNLKDGTKIIEEDFMSPRDAQEVLNQIENFNEDVNNRIEYPIEKNTDGKFQCNICSKSHISKKLIKNHILGVHAGYKWNCNKCKQEFNSTNKLKSHKIKVHADTTEDASISKQTRVSCNKCSKFFHKFGLGMHMKRKHA